MIAGAPFQPDALQNTKSKPKAVSYDVHFTLKMNSDFAKMLIGGMACKINELQAGDLLSYNS